MKGFTDDERLKGAFFYYAGNEMHATYLRLVAQQRAEIGEDIEIAHAYSDVLDLFDEEFLRANNTDVQISVFDAMKKTNNEKWFAFVSRLRQQLRFCGHNDETQEILIKQKIIANCGNKETRAKLLKKDRSLADVLTIVTTAEVVDSYDASISEQQATTSGVNAVGQDTKQNGPKCFGCGRSGHKRGENACVAKGKACYGCGRVGHFRDYCHLNRKSEFKGRQNAASKRGNSRFTKGNSNVRYVEESEDDGDAEIEYIFYLGDSKTMMDVMIGGFKVRACIDSGTKKNLLTAATWAKLKAEKIKIIQQRPDSDTIFRGYGQTEPIKILGMFKAELVINGINSTPWFYVSEKGESNLIGEFSGAHHKVLKVGDNVNNVTPFAKFKGEI